MYSVQILFFVFRQFSLYCLVKEVLRQAEIRYDEEKKWHFRFFFFFSSDIPFSSIQLFFGQLLNNDKQ